MGVGRLPDYLIPGRAERDEGFYQEILRLGHAGLRVVGGLEIAAPLLSLLGWWLTRPERGRMLLSTMILAVLGVATTLVGRAEWSYPIARRLALLSIFLSGSTMVWLWPPELLGAGLAAVMLSAAAALPLQPYQMLLMGVGLEFSYLLSQGMAAEHHVLIFILIFLGTSLVAVSYSQRLAHYRSYLDALRATHGLRTAQSRLLLSDHAATMGRLAAALAHELSSPIGTLTSATDTLLALAARQATAPPADQPRLAALQAELRRSVRESIDRLKRIVDRMHTATNLDETEAREVDLNRLLAEAASTLESEVRRAHVDFDLNPLPPVLCKPQQLMAVFCNVLKNSLDAVQVRNGDGRIVLATRRRESELEISIGDNGRGIAKEDLARIFDPGFKVTDGRVSTGNWSLFSTRQIVIEHGGQIRIDSEEGRGTTVCITLPY
ncbi:MAG: HAMP domain-containing sensor histidine kinase [Bryobacteraceae bacterium]